MGDPTEEIVKPLPSGVQKLVLLAHDESTCTVNDGSKASWVLEGEQPILKKGTGYGSHHSDVICSTFEWLKNAGVQIQYRKNYDRFWMGELFIKQVIHILHSHLLLILNFKAQRENYTWVWETPWPRISSPDYGW
jgi:hypothetical protein